MSFLDSYYESQRVDKIRRLLGRRKKNFLREAGLIANPDLPRKGKLPAYPKAAVAALEHQVNVLAARAETADKFAERYEAARSYAMVSQVDVARAVGVSRELVRRWRMGWNHPTPDGYEKLAGYLKVPAAWLELGGAHRLPPDSRIGLRVADEARHWREQLYGMTLELFAEMPALTVVQAGAYVESRLLERGELSAAARRAGGRWLPGGGTLVFSEWEPLEPRGLCRKDWSDEVERMIAEELATACSTYRAWQRLRDRCEAAGLPYPKLITLHKRMQRQRQRCANARLSLAAPRKSL